MQLFLILAINRHNTCIFRDFYPCYGVLHEIGTATCEDWKIQSNRRIYPCAWKAADKPHMIIKKEWR